MLTDPYRSFRLALERKVLAGNAGPTAAERRILLLLLTKLCEKEIAETLRVSIHTAHNHIRAIYRKFGVQSRVELMALWL